MWGRLATPAALILIALAYGARAEEIDQPLANPGFEDGLEGWEVLGDPPMGSLSQEQAHSGTHSLKIVDEIDGKGSNVRATPLEIEGPGIFEIRGQYFPVSGGGLGIYCGFLDAAGNNLVPEPHVAGMSGSEKRWRPFSYRVYAPDDAVALELYFHSYNAAKVTGYFDDLRIVQLGVEGMRPPWEGTYKIDPDQTERLTPADVVGPDGLVYPDWTRAGVQGGIPDVPAVTSVADFGGLPDDDADDADALDAACRAAGEQGGGAVLLGEGTWHLDRTVRHDGVVIRGAGADSTRVIFRYGLGEAGIRFYTPEEGGRVGPNTRIELHCAPTGLQQMRIAIDDVVLRDWERSTHSGNTFAVGVSARRAFEELEDGQHTLIGIGTYADGTKRRLEMPIILDAGYDDDRDVPRLNIAIGFVGGGYAGPRLPLAEDGERGAMQVVLESTEGLEVGDVVVIDGPATERWKQLTRNACQWGSYRRNMYEIVAIDGTTISFDQPLRIEFPVIDGSYVQRLQVIRGCGLEDLTIEQTENLWITTSEFLYAWDCWARAVTVHMCGRNPVYGHMAKFCTIRDCVFDDAWFKGGGGTAYCGWDHCFDCLMEDVETFRLRHAPLYQWAASGNVIRNGVFHESDGQWHSGWTNENLFENCVITSRRGHGSYGYGMWASPPEDTAHGPNGPRNVVWGCDVTSERDGVWMGGMNENWLILYNRFVVSEGEGVDAKDASFDHIIRGNVFALQDENAPMLRLRTPDCIGVELIDNALYGGNGRLVEGMGEPAVMEGNEVHPLPEGDLPPRPTPPVPSIYEWQLGN
ncbi:MAG: right-handed parallel beta-helix repeat-containing protein [Armatimonadota bacterium]